MLKIKKMMALSILLLSGCQGNNTSSAYVSSTSNPITSTTSSSTSIITTNKYNDIFYDGYYKTTEQSVYYKDVRNQYRFKNDLPSIGNQKILVVPITFTDSTFVEEELGGHEKVKNDLETMFFGEAEETSWESVSSFYKKSSYNKLNLSGKVADWFNIDMTFSQASSLRLPYGVATPSVLMAREVADWYKKTYNDISEYDLDNNGYIDALWIVYDWPAKHLYDGSFDWAHCYWDYTNTQEPEEGNPIPYTYAWASAGFMYEGNYSKPDAHTFIHETGHMLSLEDYYDRDYKHSYSGSVEMMDHNIGDHNMFSKYLLNWANPYVITDECEITIRPSPESGDFINVKDDWNHAANDEYLLIEYYTPTGLNEMDAKESYMGEYPKLYQNPGIKIYHVDARLAYLSHHRFSKYVDTIMGIEDNEAFSTVLAHTNTSSENAQLGISNNYYLLHMLENTEKKYIHGSRTPATDESLFHEGDIFDPIDHEMCFVNPEYFNDGEFISYTMEVISLTDENATLKFNRL